MSQPTKGRVVFYTLNHDDIEAIKDINPTHKKGDVVAARVTNTFTNGNINIICDLDGPDPLFVKIPPEAKTTNPEVEEGCWHWPQIPKSEPLMQQKEAKK